MFASCSIQSLLSLEHSPDFTFSTNSADFSRGSFILSSNAFDSWIHSYTLTYKFPFSPIVLHKHTMSYLCGYTPNFCNIKHDFLYLKCLFPLLSISPALRISIHPLRSSWNICSFGKTSQIIWNLVSPTFVISLSELTFISLISDIVCIHLYYLSSPL